MYIRENTLLAQTLNGMRFSMGVNAHAWVDKTWHANGLQVPFNRLYVVEEGWGQLWTQQQTVRMEPGFAYLIPAGCPCSYCCPERMRKIFFHFNLFRKDRYDLLWNSNQIGVLPISENMDLYKRYLGETLEDALAIQGLILQLVAAYLRSNGEIGLGDTVCSPCVESTIAYIHENLSAKLRLDALAQRVFLSRSSLSAQFRKETGVTLGKYIDEQLMMEAQRRLCTSNDSIGIISRDLGFCDQFYFSRRFTQLCGITPQKYRKEQQLALPEGR